jgi:hypothetical protein
MTHQTGLDAVAARNAAAPPQKAADVGARIECVESTPEGSNARAPLSAFRDVSSPLFIGIDPGLTGAIALIGRGLVEVEDLPVCDRPRAGAISQWLDAVRLAALLRAWSVRFDFALRAVSVVIEQPRPMPQMPSTTSASLFDTVGAIRGVIATRQWANVLHADPKAWKRGYGLKADDKRASIDCARRLYPSAAYALARAKDHNRAEAILLAHYGEGELS